MPGKFTNKSRQIIKAAIAALFLLLQDSHCYGQIKWGISTQTVMLDIAPAAATIIGAMAIGIPEGNGLAVKGIGFGLNYEYVISRTISLGLRGAYTMVGLESRGFTLDIHSACIESHVRWYPWRLMPGQQWVFFVDGFTGYSNIILDLSSEFTEMIGYRELIKPYIEDIKLSFSHYFKSGVKAGFKFVLWDSGQYGNLVAEAALGYALALGGGAETEDHLAPFGSNSSLSGLIDIIGSVIFAGGPRLSLSIGWMF